MADLPFGTRSYRRDHGSFPPFRLVNMFLEREVTSQTGVALIDRPGTQDVANWATGTVHAVFQQDGLFDGDRFALIGSGFYREGALLGAVAGYGEASIAASAVEIVVTKGTKAYSYDLEETFEQIELPDDFDCRKVLFIAGLFIFVRDGGHRWYWSSVLDARSVDDLDFASAESSPDPLLDAWIVGDNLALGGSDSLEFWMLTGELALPFSRISQRLFKKGVKATGAGVEADNTLIFVSNENRVYRVADVPQRISDHSVEERIAASGSVKCFRFSLEGHEFVAVRGDDFCKLIDFATSEWCDFETLGRTNWRANCACIVDGLPLFGDDTTGALFQFGGHQDEGVDVERIFTAALPVSGGSVPVDSIEIEYNSGSTEELFGEGGDPVVEMRQSRDGGRKWAEWRGIAAGRQGQGRKRARWRRCGYADAPGMMFEFRQTDPGPFRVSAVRANEAAGGRGR